MIRDIETSLDLSVIETPSDCDNLLLVRVIEDFTHCYPLRPNKSLSLELVHVIAYYIANVIAAHHAHISAGLDHAEDIRPAPDSRVVAVRWIRPAVTWQPALATDIPITATVTCVTDCCAIAYRGGPARHLVDETTVYAVVGSTLRLEGGGQLSGGKRKPTVGGGSTNNEATTRREAHVANHCLILEHH